MTNANFPDSPGTAGSTGDYGATTGTATGATTGTSTASTGSVSGTGTAGSAGTSGGGSTTDEAKQQAKQAAGTAKEETRHVAAVAQGEAQNVAAEAKNQATMLLEEARTQVDEQSRAQRDRLVGTLRTFGDDLEQMASQGGNGMAAEVARQVADRARTISSRLDGREPAELLDEVRAFARRRPGAFLLGAVAAGMVAGRLTRGAREAQSSAGGGQGHGSAPYAGTGSPTGGLGSDPLASPGTDPLSTVPTQARGVTEPDTLTGTLPSPGTSVAAGETWSGTTRDRDLT